MIYDSKIGKSIKEFFTTLIDVPGNFIKDLIADILAFFGFYDTARTFRDFDLTTFISETIQKAYDYVVGLFKFGVDKAKTALKKLLGFAFGEGGLMDIVLAPVSKATLFPTSNRYFESRASAFICLKVEGFIRKIFCQSNVSGPGMGFHAFQP